MVRKVENIHKKALLLPYFQTPDTAAHNAHDERSGEAWWPTLCTAAAQTPAFNVSAEQIATCSPMLLRRRRIEAQQRKQSFTSLTVWIMCIHAEDEMSSG